MDDYNYRTDFRVETKKKMEIDLRGYFGFYVVHVLMLDGYGVAVTPVHRCVQVYPIHCT